jgi:hypothetical protein
MQYGFTGKDSRETSGQVMEKPTKISSPTSFLKNLSKRGLET